MTTAVIPVDGTQLTLGGTISGGTIGVRIYGGAGTVTNAGTISGASNAVLLATGYANRAIVNAGGVFVGKVDGGNTLGATAVSTLELASSASAGTLASLGSQFTHFANITVDSGATWTLTADSIGAGYTIVDSGTLTNTGSIGSAITMGSGAQLTNAATGTIASAGTATVLYGTTLGSATVVNAGVIVNTNTAGIGIELDGGGIVTNQAGGRISAVGSEIGRAHV